MPSATEAYKNLSKEERQRGTDLEALLTFHSLIRSDAKQEELKKQIYDNMIDLEYEQSRLIADLNKDEVANNAELKEQINKM